MKGHMGNTLITEDGRHGVVTLRLNRPQSHNAIDAATIDELTGVLARLQSNPDIRAVIIRGSADAFCSGVDIAWMQHMLKSENADDARRVAHLLLSLRNLNKPTIALLEGPCVGGGVAIAACCDIVIATEEASFALPAVQLGTIPSVIAPFVIEAIGVPQARRWFLTGETFSADKAKEIGLVHAICMAAQLEATLGEIVTHLLRGAPKAMAGCKEMINAYAGKPITPALIDDMARRIVESRRSQEAQEGLDAFLAKRPPAWLRED